MSAQVRFSVAFSIKATWPAIIVKSSRMVGVFHNEASPTPRLTARLEQPVPPRKLCTAISRASSCTAPGKARA